MIELVGHVLSSKPRNIHNLQLPGLTSLTDKDESRQKLRRKTPRIAPLRCGRVRASVRMCSFTRVSNDQHQQSKSPSPAGYWRRGWVQHSAIRCQSGCGGPRRPDDGHRSAVRSLTGVVSVLALGRFFAFVGEVSTHRLKQAASWRAPFHSDPPMGRSARSTGTSGSGVWRL